MGEKSRLIKSLIASIVRKYLPKHEEVIHSSLFLISTQGEGLTIPDWYYNGYSVISETVSSYLQALCMEKTLIFTNEGIYSMLNEVENLSNEEFKSSVSNVDSLLSNCDSGMTVVKEARKLFQLKQVGNNVAAG